MQTYRLIHITALWVRSQTRKAQLDGKERRLCAFGVAIFLLMANPAIADEVSRGALDRLWQEHMLAGTFGIYADGQRQNYTPKELYESARGSPHSAAFFTKGGIVVSDHTETRFLGLWRGGGWTLQGGLLGRVEELNSEFELYGKEIIRKSSFFVLNIRAWHIPKEEVSYEFFLLHRKKGNPRATVLKKWIIRPEELQLDENGLPVGATAYLRYDRATNTATIIMEGLKHSFREQLDLSAWLRS